MQKKYFNFQPKGMNTNMSPKFQSNEYATYMKNIRITKDDNGVLSLQFEKGNVISKLGNITGTVIGTCVLNKYLVLFTHYRGILDGGYVTTDTIYRISIENDELTKTTVFSGDLGFDTSHPIETLGVYENENIQKVYFVDGLHQARVINIMSNYTTKYSGSLAAYKNSSLDFVATLQLKETLSVTKILGTGEFPQGTIQYVFSYYDKHGRQSNLFKQSALQYLSYDTGVSPEEKVNCSFKIKITNLDKQFDYLRIYSIIRTSQDAIPTCKRVVDLEIKNNSNEITYIDNGTIGDIIDNTELLYLGGNTICPNTFEQKDNTLFIGNYTIQNNDISDTDAVKIRNLLYNKVKFVESVLPISWTNQGYFNYEGQLNNSDVAGFKYLEWYGVAVQFQNKNGRFSTPIYLGSVRNYYPTTVFGNVNRAVLNINVTTADINNTIPNFTNTWVKARVLIVNPTNNLRTILGQGIISPTVFNYKDRYDNAPFAMSSWRMVPLGDHLNPLIGNASSLGEIQNISNTHSPILSETGNTNVDVLISYRVKNSLYEILVVNIKEDKLIYNVLQNTIKEAKDALKQWNNSINITKISDTDWTEKGTITKQTITFKDINSILTFYSENFAYDESIVTFNSPDIDNFTNNVSTNNKLRIIGILQVYDKFSNYLIQGTDLNDPSKGKVTNKGITDFKSNLLWRDMDSSWDNLSDYDYNKDWLFATYLWHRETSYSDNGIEKKNSNGSSRKVWSKPLKKIIANVRICIYASINKFNSPITSNIENQFHYYELPIGDIKIITTNNDSIYKLDSNMDNRYTDSISYSADVNKLFPTTNSYNIFGNKNSSSILNVSNITYNKVIIDNKEVTSQDPIRIKYKETPHAIISFGRDSDFKTIKLPRLCKSHTSDVDNGTIASVFWKESGVLYTNDYLWSKYMREYPSFTENKFTLYDTDITGGYFYLADLCVQNPDISPYEAYNGNEDIISQYSFIPSGDTFDITSNVVLTGTIGDTYYQRWDCLKTFPYSTDDKNQYIDITSFFIESRINLDGRYDKQRGLKYNLGVLNTNFNLINSSYTQRNNFFNYRQIKDEGVNNFPNQIVTSNTKTLGEEIDSWTNITLASVFDLDGDKGKLNAIRKINNDLYCFQDSGVSRLLYNSRVQINTSDGVPIEIANSAKLQDKQYISDSIGCQNKWAIESTPSGLYFVDTYNSELYRLNDKGLAPISQNKFKNYFTKISTNVWKPKLWSTTNDKIDSVRLQYDSTTSDLYIISSDTALAYNELLGEFTSFYDYGSTSYWVNLNNKSIQILNSNYNTSLYEAYKGLYGKFYGESNKQAIVEFIANGDFDLDKIFETVELTTSDTASVNTITGSNWYPFDTLEVSNEYQSGSSTASINTVRKKFRTWRYQIPRNNKANPNGLIVNRDRIRNMWAKIKLTKTYNTSLSIYDINVAYYS